jgi:hypothetical protein
VFVRKDHLPGKSREAERSGVADPIGHARYFKRWSEVIRLVAAA